MKAPIAAWVGAALLCGLAGCGQSSPVNGGGSGVANPAQADATRFLEQSSFGPTPATIQTVMQQGIPAYLDAQFAAIGSNYNGFPVTSTDSATGCPALVSSSTCIRDKYSAFPLQVRFYQNTLTQPDQLRQRIALALSQLFVVSANTVNVTYGLATYNQIFLDHAFGNYRDLLTQVSLSPAMGWFQDVANNGKTSGSVRPNENYARELMQLFSIGVDQLDASGQVVTSGGKPVPNYNQAVIEAMARVFTGYTYARPPGQPQPTQFNQTRYLNAPMVPIESEHDTAAKTILNGQVLPAGQTAEQDLAAALDAIFNHPNIGPFVCRRLIQHLVTANPSPGYVQRVAAVFADNGQGVRGDLQAVIRTILLDSEARGPLKTDASYGKLREPAVILPAILRGVGGNSDGVYLRQQAQAMSENLFDAPSVFNFYSPNFPLQGTSLVAPVFGIYNSATGFTRLNTVHDLLGGPIAPDHSVSGATGTSADLSGWTSLAGSDSALIGQINTVFFHDGMSRGLQQALSTAIDALPASAADQRARNALYLALTSAEFQVER